MIVKVCGLNNLENINALSALPIDLMGMIFYPKSPRYMDIPSSISLPMKGRVGVFVNESVPTILDYVKRYNLEYVQLHGDESPKVCIELAKYVAVIKAFSIASVEDLHQTVAYTDTCSFYLFDTKCIGYGGSGKKFDWSLLDTYDGNTPFLLSGGIALADSEAILNIQHPLFRGVDLNSRFETAPGVKDIDLIKAFLKSIKL